MSIPDALSRAALNDKPPKPVHDYEVLSIISQLPVSEQKLEQIRAETAKDQTLTTVTKLVQSGWPDEKVLVPYEAKPFHNFRNEITYCDGLLFRQNQIIIPLVMQSEMIKKLHSSHQGVVKTKQRARSIIFWPGMNGQIEEAVSNCSTCMDFRSKRPPEPMIPHDIPDRPWSKVGTDLCEIDSHDFLIMIDYYSKFPEVISIPDKTAHSVVRASKSIFARSGTPDLVISDNGPCFDSDTYREFACDWEFKHVTISPGYSQS